MILLKRFLKILDFILPHQCMRCKSIVGAHGVLCSECFTKIRFVPKEKCCYVCGRRMELSYKKEEKCAGCIYDPPVYSKARAVFYYDYNSKGMVLGFKYADRTEFSDVFARWMIRAYGDMDDIDMIIPVPLHFKRLFLRKYNQAALLAQHIADITGKIYNPFVLRRIRNTRVQGEFNARGRKNNVKGAFQVTDRALVKDKRILLIDDVFTTGATVSECARELVEGGALEVSILTLSRT